MDLFTDYTLRIVVLGSALLGAVSGILGTFAVLRREGLVGDALAHAALPGICLAFMVTGARTPLILMIGAALSGWLGTLVLLRLVRDTKLEEDAGLGIVLSVFFGVGIVLLTFIQRGENAAQAGLDRYLFGQAATLLEEHVITMSVLGLAALVVLALLYKEFKVLTFDPTFAASIGLPAGRLNVILMSLVVVAIVIGLQTVGVVLMAALLVGPAAAARQWTDRLRNMILISGLIGAVAGATGALISVSAERIPTGPMIILSLTVLVVFSLLFGRARGLVWEWLRPRRVQPAPEVGR